MECQKSAQQKGLRNASLARRNGSHPGLGCPALASAKSACRNGLGQDCQSLTCFFAGMTFDRTVGGSDCMGSR